MPEELPLVTGRRILKSTVGRGGDSFCFLDTALTGSLLFLFEDAMDLGGMQLGGFIRILSSRLLPFDLGEADCCTEGEGGVMALLFNVLSGDSTFTLMGFSANDLRNSDLGSSRKLRWLLLDSGCSRRLDS